MAVPTRNSIEVNSAGCTMCRQGIRAVQEFAGKDHVVTSHDMHIVERADARAKELGINRVPAVVVNVKLAQCCQSRPVDVGVIRSMMQGKA